MLYQDNRSSKRLLPPGDAACTVTNIGNFNGSIPLWPEVSNGNSGLKDQRISVDITCYEKYASLTALFHSSEKSIRKLAARTFILAITIFESTRCELASWLLQ